MRACLKNVKKAVSALLAVLLVAAVLPAAFAAEDNADVTAQQTSIIVRASQIKDYGTYNAIQSALDTARFSATDDNIYMVVVESGSYTLTRALHIYSNTHLVLTGVTLTRSGKSTANMLRTGDYDTESTGAVGYDAHSNITVEGGVFDGGATQNTMLKIAHAKNFKLIDCELKNVKNGHIMEVAGVDGFTVSNCVFKDQSMDAGKVGYEAVQLDILKKGHIVECRSEALVMKNVLIENCSFENCPRGIGTHTAILNSPFSGIIIRNNSFKNMGSAAVQGMNWENCEISGNTIDNAPRGIAVYSVMDSALGTYPASVLANEGGTYTGISEKYSAPADSGITISDNTIINCGGVQDIYAPYESAAISVIGRSFEKVLKKNSDGSGALPKGDYYVQGVTISGNTIEAKGHGIRLCDVRSASLSRNSVTCEANEFDSSVKYQAVKLHNGCKAISIEGCDIDSSPNCGIYIDESSVSKISDNLIANSALDCIRLINKSSVAEITNSYIRDAGGNGVNVLSKSTAGKIEGNTIYNCSGKAVSAAKNAKAKVGSNSGSAVELNSITLNRDALTMGVGESYSLDMELSPKNAKSRFSWTSNDISVATVTQSGTVTAVGEGRADLLVKSANGVMTCCSVNVKKAPEKITLNSSMLILGIGEEFNLDSVIDKGSASQTIEYSSNNGGAASVSAAGGIIKANGFGTATVVAQTFNGKRASCNVIVKSAPWAVWLEENELSLGVGEKFTLKSRIPDNTASAVKFKSSDSGVAEVSPDGEITAKGQGTAVITASTFNGCTESCTVNVLSEPEKISLNKKSLTLKAGESFTFESVIPDGAASRGIAYKSSDSNVCRVEEADGKIRAKSKGKALITVTSYNGKTASCKVTVI